MGETLERLRKQAQEHSSFAQDPRPSGSGEELIFKVFEQLPIPKVLALARTVVMLFLAGVDSKGIPTATEEKLKKRRRPRRMHPLPERAPIADFQIIRRANGTHARVV